VVNSGPILLDLLSVSSCAGSSLRKVSSNGVIDKFSELMERYMQNEE